VATHLVLPASANERIGALFFTVGVPPSLARTLSIFNARFRVKELLIVAPSTRVVGSPSGCSNI
jgi:hypothetical protein